MYKGTIKEIRIEYFGKATIKLNSIDTDLLNEIAASDNRVTINDDEIHLDMTKDIKTVFWDNQTEYYNECQAVINKFLINEELNNV